MRSIITITVTVAVALLALAGVARADDPYSDEALTDQARAAYHGGVAAVKKAQWADALVLFEKSSRLRPHPATTFSIGACERALGRYLRARATLQRALVEGGGADKRLPSELATDAQAFIGEIETLLAHVQVHLEPSDAAIVVDGRPLLPLKGAAGTRPVLLAAMQAPGAGQPPPAADFELVVEPGPHVIILTRQGYAAAVVNRTFLPGARTSLPLELARLPATIHVTANREAAVVTVDALDVGAAPVEVSRPAGGYQVAVRKRGYTTYQTRVTVQPGERVDLTAPLAVEKRPVYKQWWFWTGAVVLVGGGVGVTYGLTRPPPPYDGGNTGWVAQPR